MPAGQSKKPSDPLTHLPIVGIGASAGGLEAVTELLKHLPVDTGLGFVLVQHLDPQHESALTQILARATSMPVREITDNLPVEANHVYIIPPNANLSMTKGVLNLRRRQQARTPPRSIDFFFESLAQDQGKRAIGVILSGTATDGTLGLEAIKAEGGITFAQDESARYDSMPRSAINSGCVDFILKPEDIAKELARIAKHPYIAGQLREGISPEEDRAAATEHEDDETPPPSGGSESPRTGARQARAEAQAACAQAGENGFKKILLLLRNHSGVDFSLYKSTTIQRRIARRTLLNNQNTLEGYARLLRGNAKELDALYSDVLISVTSFFRNPEAFDVLKSKVFPKLLQQRGDDPLRVWVLGCSTGQEAYSIAMAFVEAAENAPRARKLQVFATDLNDALLDKARHGLYVKSLAQDVTPKRLRRFFIEEEGGYRVNKALREMVVFARQNLLGDPPFSRMDLISCRNLLIYLEPSLQKKAIPVFHYALKPGGFLLLGASESIGSFTELFEPLDRKHKIYFKKAAPTPAFQLPVRKERGEHLSAGLRPLSAHSMGRGQGEGQPEGVRSELNAQREADRVTVNQFAPPGVLINADLQILQFRGPTSAYLEPPTGKASFNVLKMAREGLMLPLRAAINRAKKENKSARKEDLRINQNGKTRKVNVEVIPLKNLRERCFLILFEDDEKAARAVAAPSREQQSGGAVRTPHPASKKAESRRIAELETDLSETRDYLQSVQEQHETAKEELQASNEEVQSSNEELQSINEELETSKEELESANEELTTLNEELSNRNTELSRLNSDLANLETSTHLAIVLLGRDLIIRRFSAQAEKQFNLLASDVGRPITSIRHNLVVDEAKRAVRGAPPSAADAQPRREGAARYQPLDLEGLITEVITNVRECEDEVQDKDGDWFSLRVRPYMTVDNKLDGAVLVLVDINAIKHSERIQAALDFAESTVDTVREPLLVLDGELRVRRAGRAFYQTFGVLPEETVGRLLYDLGNRQWNIPLLRTLLEEILPRQTTLENFEVVHDFEHLGRRTMLLNARLLEDPVSRSHWILLAIEDITEGKQQAQELERARLAEAVLRTARDPLLILDAGLRVHMANEAFYRTFQVSPVKTEGRLINELGNGQWGVPRLRQLLEDLLLRNSVFDNFEVTHDFETIGRRTMLLNARPLSDPSGKSQKVLLSIQDLTELLHFQAALRRSELRYRRLFEAAHDGVLILDSVSRKITDANPFIVELLGYTREELLGKELWQIGLLKAEQASHAAFRELQQRGQIRYEDLLESKSGEQREVEVVANRYEEDGKQVIQCNIRDITKRKQAEEALRASEERYRTLFDFDPVAIYSCDASGVIQQFNRRAAELWGREPASGDTDERFCGSFKLFRPDGSFMPHEQCPMAEVIAGKIPAAHDAEVLIERPDGSRITVVVNIRPLKTARGEITGAINCFYDITQRKRAEEELAQAHAELQSHAEELARFNRAAVGRELRMIELKKEINEFRQRQGEPARYSLEFEEEEGKESDG